MSDCSQKLWGMLNPRNFAPRPCLCGVALTNSSCERTMAASAATVDEKTALTLYFEKTSRQG